MSLCMCVHVYVCVYVRVCMCAGELLVWDTNTFTPAFRRNFKSSVRAVAFSKVCTYVVWVCVCGVYVVLDWLISVEVL